MSELNQDYMFQKESAEYLQTTERKIALFRKHGLLKYGKLGKNYVYRKEWLNQFMEEWCGYDLSNEENIKLAMHSKQWRNKHGFNHEG